MLVGSWGRKSNGEGHGQLGGCTGGETQRQSNIFVRDGVAGRGWHHVRFRTRGLLMLTKPAGTSDVYNSKALTGLSRFSFNEPRGS
jgi:hypothetical protein